MGRERRELSGLDPGDRFLESPSERRGGLRGEVGEVEGERSDVGPSRRNPLRAPGADLPDVYEAPARREGVEARADEITSEPVKHDVDAASLGEAPDLVGEVAGSRVDDAGDSLLA